MRKMRGKSLMEGVSFRWHLNWLYLKMITRKRRMPVWLMAPGALQRGPAAFNLFSASL